MEKIINYMKERHGIIITKEEDVIDTLELMDALITWHQSKENMLSEILSRKPELKDEVPEQNQ